MASTNRTTNPLEIIDRCIDLIDQLEKDLKERQEVPASGNVTQPRRSGFWDAIKGLIMGDTAVQELPARSDAVRPFPKPRRCQYVDLKKYGFKSGDIVYPREIYARTGWSSGKTCSRLQWAVEEGRARKLGDGRYLLIDTTL